MTEERPVLDYRIPTPSDDDGQKAHFLLGCALTIFGTLTAVFFLSLATLSLHQVPAAMSDFAALALGATAFLTINGLAIFLYRRPSSRAFAKGIWAGFIVAALLEGACFTAISRL